MAHRTRPEGAHDAAFPFMHPSRDGETLVYHPGLTKLEMFVLAEVMSGHNNSGPSSVVYNAIAQMRAMEKRCSSCLSERHSLDVDDQTLYTCINENCEMYGVNEVLAKKGFTFELNRWFRPHQEDLNATA
jgi:hypothetical protein